MPFPEVCTDESSTLLESMTETPWPLFPSLRICSTLGWNSVNETPLYPLSLITQFSPITPPFAITTPDPVEFSTKRLEISAGPLLVQLVLLKSNPAPSWTLVGESGPLFLIVTLVRFVDESVVNALNPIISFSSMSASDTLTPEVLRSNAAPIPNPGVFAPGPPVPLMTIPSKIAFVCKLE